MVGILLSYWVSAYFQGRETLVSGRVVDQIVIDTQDPRLAIFAPIEIVLVFCAAVKLLYFRVACLLLRWVRGYQWISELAMHCIHVGVSKNRGETTQNGGFIMESPMNKWMIWFLFPLFLVQHPCNFYFQPRHGWG